MNAETLKMWVAEAERMQAENGGRLPTPQWLRVAYKNPKDGKPEGDED